MSTERPPQSATGVEKRDPREREPWMPAKWEPKAALHEWIRVEGGSGHNGTDRMRVPGGWIYRVTSDENTTVMHVLDPLADDPSAGG